MNKTAAVRSQARRAVLTKAAGIATDYLATLPSQALAHSGIPIVSQVAALTNMGGSLGGLITDPKKEKNPKTDAMSLIPGVGNYRLSQRSRRVMDESNRRGARGTANLIAEYVGPLTGSIIGAGAGGALGGALGSLKRDTFGRTKAGPGAAIGAVAGGVLPALIGSIAAGIRRKRTLDEQAAADTKGRAVSKYLVPGLAQYDSFKRLGASSHLDDKSKKTDKNEKKEKKAAEAAFTAGFHKAAETLGVDPGALMKAAKILGGPDPVPGMLGASATARSPGFSDRRASFVDSLPSGHVSIGRNGLRPITIGDIRKMTAGMSPIKRTFAMFNPLLLHFDGFRKSAETAGADHGALAGHMAVKKAYLARKNALRWLLRLGSTSGAGRVRTRIADIGGRLQGVGRLSPKVDENLTQMSNIAKRLDEYTAARGAAGGWLGTPDWVGSTLPKGKKLFPQLIEDAGSGASTALSDAASNVLRSVGYIK